MNTRTARNAVVRHLGTPDRFEGSVNNPIHREENGFRFNEKWVYRHLVTDPSGMTQRVIYWDRYDFAGTMVRADEKSEWRQDESLVRELASADPRLAHLEPSNNQPIQPSNRYRPVSDFKGKADLGGHVQRN